MKAHSLLHRSVLDASADAGHNALVEIRVDGDCFVYIYDFYLGMLDRLAQYDGIIIETTKSIFTRHAVWRIRSYFEHNLFLLPLFLRRSSRILDASLGAMTDGYVSTEESLFEVVSITRSIQENREKIRLPEMADIDAQVILGHLAYGVSRGQQTIKPIIDRDCRMGYLYPIISAIEANGRIRSSVVELLDEAESLGYVKARMLQSTYVCSSCEDAFLQFREVCPACLSSDIVTEEVVHHFRCAHVAPLSDFRQEIQGGHILECPKCNHELKHIGVDFDKPSSMHRCRSCNKDFQNYHVYARCTTCDHDQNVEHLIKRDVKEYDITDKALASLQRGLSAREPDQLGEVIPETMDWSLFIKALAFEADRPGASGQLVSIEIEDLKGLIKQIGSKNKNKLLTELIQVIKASQGARDMRNVQLPFLYFTLLDTSAKDAEDIAQRTVFLLNHLLKDNLSIKQALLTTELTPITKGGVTELERKKLGV
ncbi:MAG: hypothetical protein HKN87_23080 [Saprospiraceae bacterium]|nr:hypothetical protein [Saprospiraceae bacterium]